MTQTNPFYQKKAAKARSVRIPKIHEDSKILEMHEDSKILEMTIPKILEMHEDSKILDM